MESTLKKYFGYSVFRPYQKEIIEKILERRDCLVIMATGSGKSLCYQIPPLFLRKTGVIISPLIALMQDQVMSLKQRGIKAEYLGSTQTDPTVHKNAEIGRFDILYMTPERACSLPLSFWSNLLKTGICLLAVDEAHCISEWGHDFRKEYKQLDKIRCILLDVPFVGLTATATEKVRVDIINSLRMKDPYIAIGSFDRCNLFYGVKSFNRGLTFVDEFVGEISKSVATAGSTIIYCTTIKDAEQIFKSLHKAGIKTGIYHGQMTSKAREDSHRSFIRDEQHVMVATIAFGMGVDKPNIRCVIHYGCPKSLESYYQESGRCGRDGLASMCWLYYTRSDFAKADFYCGDSFTGNQRKAIMESLMAAKQYCLLASCRRKFLLDHFGEKFTSDKCGSCDNCTNSKRERDMSREAFLLMSCIQSCRGCWGLNMPVDILRGSRSRKILDVQFDKLPLHGLGKDHSSNWWKALASQLIAYGYLVETVKDLYRTVSVSSKGVQFLGTANPDHQPPPIVLSVTSDMIDDEEDRSKSGKVEDDLKILAALDCEGFSEAEAKLYHILLDVRMKLARSTGTAPYAICGDHTIKQIAMTRPSTKARLANIDGVNQHLVTTYGEHFLQNIRHSSQGLNLSLDGEASMQTAVTKREYPVPNNQGKLTPAKFEAWKMWNEDGLSIQKIANFPGRPTPIKVETVFEYVLEAAKEGFAINWTRFCEEAGLTLEVLSEIQTAISKVGSREKLKPIKNELPEHVSYTLIKACLTMLDLGISPEVIAGPLSLKVAELSPKKSELSFGANLTGNMEGPPKSEVSIDDMVCSYSLDRNGGTASIPFTAGSLEIISSTKQLRTHDQFFSRKCQKIDGPYEESVIPLQATENSILEWLRSKDGVALFDILEHFNGSKEVSVVHLLSYLEGEFLIFKKNDLYRLM